MKKFLLDFIMAVFLAVFLAGCACLAWPFISSLFVTKEQQQVVEEFLVRWEKTDEGSPEEKKRYPDLWKEMCAYNQKIYKEGQTGLCDAWSYQQGSFDLSSYGIEDDVFGYIEIPSMDSRMPLFLGATDENMAKGAVVLGQTSMSIGGINTNSVIACHRGWKYAPYWRYIDRIQVGDLVSITNLWETLTYEVKEIEIIAPDDINRILIRKGKDMVTLLSCHPYGGHGRYRYAVFCERLNN